MEESENRITPEQIVFGKSFFAAKTPQGEKHRIFYRDIIWAYISVPDDRSGCCENPDIADVTENMEGTLIVCDKERCRWIFQIDQTGQKAGSLLKELCVHAPYIVAGGQDWFDITQKADFDMVCQMVKVKRACCR